MLRLYDSAAGERVEFEPRVPGRVSMYVCGPTPYDVPHVGHARTAIAFDVIRRYLDWSGYHVTYVSNVTDVEDKIIARAAARGTSESELVSEYEIAYWREMDRLGVRRPDAVPRATEFIEPMLRLIAELVDSGYAYVIEGLGVYFAVEAFPGYGRLSHRNLADLLDGAGARVEVEERKRSPVDFALWKFAKPGEPSWDSPWGEGRPGWHIECSAMALEILGERFDLHGGGDDLLFPHHENERAQAEGAGHAFARHWLHSAMVMVDGEKMSKSLGNFTSLSEALDRYGPRAFRLLALQTHYRRQMEITDEQLSAAARGVERFDDFLRRARAVGAVPAADREPASPESPEAEDFRRAMDDDFDTPQALACLFERVSEANVAIDEGDLDAARGVAALVVDLLGVLGISADDGTAGGSAAGRPSAAHIEERLAERRAAREARDFNAADAIRDELAALGVAIEDTPTGTIWRHEPTS